MDAGAAARPAPQCNFKHAYGEMRFIKKNL
jgi:hypothetical protein